MELFLYFCNNVVVTCNGLKHRFIVNLYIIMGPAVLCLLLARHNDNIQTDRLILTTVWAHGTSEWIPVDLKNLTRFLRSLYYFLYVVEMSK